MQLIAEKKAAIMCESANAKEKYRRNTGNRDLLTLLIKANMDTNLPHNQRLSDEDILARTYSSF